jgi:hypothetical protein
MKLVESSECKRAQAKLRKNKDNGHIKELHSEG